MIVKAAADPKRYQVRGADDRCKDLAPKSYFHRLPARIRWKAYAIHHAGPDTWYPAALDCSSEALVAVLVREQCGPIARIGVAHKQQLRVTERYQMFNSRHHALPRVDANVGGHRTGLTDVHEHRRNAAAMHHLKSLFVVLRGDDGDPGNPGSEHLPHTLTQQVRRKICIPQGDSVAMPACLFLDRMRRLREERIAQV